MFGPLFAFELRSHFRRPATWLYVAIMFTLAFFSVSSDAVIVGVALGKVKKNSPFTLAQLYVITLAIGQIIDQAGGRATVLERLRDLVLLNTERTVLIMSSRSTYRPDWRSSVSSRISRSELSSQGPAAIMPKATVASGRSGYSTSPATCSSMKRP
jgi:hypothetical protein